MYTEKSKQKQPFKAVPSNCMNLVYIENKTRYRVVAENNILLMNKLPALNRWKC